MGGGHVRPAVISAGAAASRAWLVVRGGAPFGRVARLWSQGCGLGAFGVQWTRIINGCIGLR